MGIVLLSSVLLGLIGIVLYFKFRSSPQPQAALPLVLEPTGMDTQEFRDFKVVDIEVLSHDTKRFRFALPPEQSLNLPLGGHVQVQMQIGTELRKKPYTPVSGNNERGYFDLVIKTYDQGKISKAFHQLAVGDTMSFKMLPGRLQYSPCSSNQTPVQQIGMLAGGTGITPMIQVLNAIANNTDDYTKVRLLYANRTREDILMKNELERLSQLKDIQVFHVLSRESEDYEGLRGYINPQIIRDYLPAPGEGVRIMLCGPPPFCKTMQEHLAALNYPPESIFKF